MTEKTMRTIDPGDVLEWDDEGTIRTIVVREIELHTPEMFSATIITDGGLELVCRYCDLSKS